MYLLRLHKEDFIRKPVNKVCSNVSMKMNMRNTAHKFSSVQRLCLVNTHISVLLLISTFVT